MQTKEVVLVKKDLEDAGINQSLTQNDLVEVIAHEIYNKYVAMVDELDARRQRVLRFYKSLFDKELEDMRLELVEAGYLEEKEEINSNFSISNHNSADGMGLLKLLVENDFKGKSIKESKNSDWYYFYIGKNKGTVKLTITNKNSNTDRDISVKNITGFIESRVDKSFEKKISATSSRFKESFAQFNSFNTELKDVLEFLPKSGILSVETFTREARVKMNKKILSSQSPEFRNKMKEIFQINL